MKIQLSGKDFEEITIGDLHKGYVNNDEEGVIGYDGKLNIRPAYQREFIYDAKKRDEVIKTVTKNFPLNTMYWAKNDDDGFEIIDGQQRTISICMFIAGDFSLELDGITTYFHSLSPDKQQKILDYPLSVYICTGSYDEKIEWFNIINIAGEELTKQELRNANFTGLWLTDAKRWFSKNGAPAVSIGDKYILARRDRQEYLETAICWAAKCRRNEESKIEEYMSLHHKDSDAKDLWTHYQSVIDWINSIFLTSEREMRGLEWGGLYDKYHNVHYDAADITRRVKELFSDPYVNNNKGVFEYLLGNSLDSSLLEVRLFDESVKRTVYEKQTVKAEAGGKSNCPICATGSNNNKDRIYELSEMDADHVTAWIKSGKTDVSNCEMLCIMHNRAKGNR